MHIRYAHVLNHFAAPAAASSRNSRRDGKQICYLIIAPVILFQVWQGDGLCDVQKGIKHFNDLLPVPCSMVTCTSAIQDMDTAQDAGK